MILHQAMRQINIRPHKFLSIQNMLHNEIAMMRKKFQVQSRDGATSAAGASSAAVHILSALTKRHVGRLDQIEQRLAMRKACCGGVDKDGVSFDLGKRHRRREAMQDQFEQFRQNLMRVFEFCPGKERGIAADVSQNEIAVLCFSFHEVLCDPKTLSKIEKTIVGSRRSIIIDLTSLNCFTV